MRRLAQQLGVEAMSLYNHVAGKQDLLDGIVEQAVAEMELPPADAADWELALREAFRSYRRLAHAHPHVFPLIGRRPVRHPQALRPVEWALEMLRRGGFDPAAALHAFRTLSSYAYGYALSEIRGFALEPATGGEEQPLRPEDFPPEEFPRIVELAQPARATDHDAEFELGLEAIFAGLRAIRGKPGG